MRYRAVVSALLVLTLAGAVHAQPSSSRRPAAPPREATAGHPDFSGTWYFGTATPLERPKDLADKATLTEEEALAFERRMADRLSRVIAVHPPEWLDYGTKMLPDRRTSLIIEPADGRIPPLTPAARERSAARARLVESAAADNPEERQLQERCLVFGAGPPLVPGPYNNNLQIVQTTDSLVLLTEMIHDARIVPIGAVAQLPDQIRRWLGSSRAHWDGDTLVVETTNFNEHVTFRGSDGRLEVTERLSLQDANTLRYEYTIDDPTAFARSWTAALVMTRSDERIYEYACHEGNYGLQNTLKFERDADRNAAPK